MKRILDLRIKQTNGDKLNFELQIGKRARPLFWTKDKIVSLFRKCSVSATFSPLNLMLFIFFNLVSRLSPFSPPFGEAPSDSLKLDKPAPLVGGFVEKIRYITKHITFD